MRNWLAELSSKSKRPVGKINVDEVATTFNEFKSFLRLNEACTAVLYAFCALRGKKQHVCIGELIEFIEPLLNQSQVADAVESLVVRGYFLFGSEGPFNNYYDHIYLSHPAERALRNSDKKALPSSPSNDFDYVLMMIYARAVSFRNRTILMSEWIKFTQELRELRELPFIHHLFRAKLTKTHRSISLFTGILHQIDQHRLEQSTIIHLFCNSALEIARLKKELLDPSHPLFTSNVLERYKNEHGMIRIGAHPVWAAMIHETDEQPQKVLPSSPALQLFDYQSIIPKKLFYNPETNGKVEQLRKILIPSNLRKFEKIAHKNGEPGGIISLLSGGPGTGKTELARQLALETGRDLLFFDVTQQRNMYFGETEKAIKQVFDDYQRICKQSKNAPILFFNEGDAVFSSRTAMKGNMTQTENSVQTILLQEMEVFNGVMIITTNRPESFDAAFGRRILLNIEINDPVAEVRVELLGYFFPSLPQIEAKKLAESYSFTAAQLGVFRKQWELNGIIKSSKLPLLEALETYLQSLSGKPIKRIGFNG
jgi:hypothetical protein